MTREAVTCSVARRCPREGHWSRIGHFRKSGMRRRMPYFDSTVPGALGVKDSTFNFRIEFKIHHQKYFHNMNRSI